MDPVSVSALVALLSKIFDGAAGKAGEQAWDSLSSTVRRAFSRRSTSAEAVKRLGERPGDPEAIKALAEALVADSDLDPQAAVQLRHWMAGAQRTLAGGGSVTNVVSGEVRGNVVQSRDIHGGITF